MSIPYETDEVREKIRDVVVCAGTMIADNEIDGWQGNVNVNLALDALLRAYGRAVVEKARRQGLDGRG